MDIAAEIRAEMARKRVGITDLAERAGMHILPGRPASKPDQMSPHRAAVPWGNRASTAWTKVDAAAAKSDRQARRGRRAFLAKLS